MTLGQEPLTGEYLTHKDVPMYVSDQEGSSAGIIVIQGIYIAIPSLCTSLTSVEWWGLTDHIKRMTQRFADQVGALALTPDVNSLSLSCVDLTPAQPELNVALPRASRGQAR